MNVNNRFIGTPVFGSRVIEEILTGLKVIATFINPVASPDGFVNNLVR
jgi:hypothetical protein